MNRWVAGARPKTLPAAVVPVLVGTASAAGVASGGIVWWRAAAAMVTALGIQVGTNYANDYSDGKRGTDDPTKRVGPVRLVGSRLASARAVFWAAIASFAVAGVAGVTLSIVVDLRLLIVGATSFLAGWLYTGGPRPYGYAGLGELFVFGFFGVVATAGSAYVQTEELTGLAVAASIPIGCLATALLVVNNLRDIPSDSAAGKRTLAVKLGAGRTRALYVALIAGSAVAPLVMATVGERPAALLALLAVPLAGPPVQAVLGGAVGPALLPVLGATGRVQLMYGLLFASGLAVSA